MNFFALSLSNPTPIISFARSHNLLDEMPFRHLTQYSKIKTAVEIAKIHELSASPTSIRYKFGIQGPKGIKSAIELDKKNESSL
jgi:hypothetical protein